MESYKHKFIVDVCSSRVSGESNVSVSAPAVERRTPRHHYQPPWVFVTYIHWYLRSFSCWAEHFHVIYPSGKYSPQFWTRSCITSARLIPSYDKYATRIFLVSQERNAFNVGLPSGHKEWRFGRSSFHGVAIIPLVWSHVKGLQTKAPSLSITRVPKSWIMV